MDIGDPPRNVVDLRVIAEGTELTRMTTDGGWAGGKAPSRGVIFEIQRVQFYVPVQVLRWLIEQDPGTATAVSQDDPLRGFPRSAPVPVSTDRTRGTRASRRRR